jgi:hypothetical protein
VCAALVLFVRAYASERRHRLGLFRPKSVGFQAPPARVCAGLGRTARSVVDAEEPNTAMDVAAGARRLGHGTKSRVKEIDKVGSEISKQCQRAAAVETETGGRA